MRAQEGEGFKVMVRKLFGILAVLVLVAPASAFAQGLPTVASAQVGTASVKGLVKDSSGGSLRLKVAAMIRLHGRS